MIPISRPHIGDLEIENVVNVLRYAGKRGGSTDKTRRIGESDTD
jgi:hypothetical protein